MTMIGGGASACGGGDAATARGPTGAGADPAETAASSASASKTPAAEKGGECGVEALPPAELVSVLQQTLDLDAMKPFWHDELPNRKPLVVLRSHVCKDEPKLSKFGKPVVFVDADKAEDPYFAFTRVDAHGETVSVTFSYPVEGVTGRAVFAKKNGAWVLTGKEVAER
jgi:hypothetical protein